MAGLSHQGATMQKKKKKKNELQTTTSPPPPPPLPPPLYGLCKPFKPGARSASHVADLHLVLSSHPPPEPGLAACQISWW